MPFCPICKAEYQEGFTVCADCKVDLVDDIEEAKEAEVLIPFFQADDKKVAEKLVKFFNYSDVNSSLTYDKDIGVYIVSIPPKKQLEAKKLYQAFYFVERERMANGESDLFADEAEQEGEEGSDIEITEDTGEPAEETIEGSFEAAEDSEETLDASEEDFDHSLEPADSSEKDDYHGETPSDEVTAFDEEEEDSAPYVMKADQYKDLTGTVGVFLFFGIAGLIVVLINLIGIINIFSGWIPNTVMTALFLFFIYVALLTNKKAKTIQVEIDEENAMTEKINEWLKKNITEEFLTSIHNETISDELNYIKKTDVIKEMLIKEFGNQNLAYLDRLIEEYYYNTFDNL
jgi:hypothetical protein